MAVLAVVGVLPPYLGPILGFELATRDIVEVVDHVFSAVAVLVVAVAALVRGRIGLVGGVIAFLSGIWMFGTHVPLLVQAWEPGTQFLFFQIPAAEVAWGTALFHSTPSLAVLVAGVMALFVWTAQEERAQAGDEARVDADAGTTT